MICRPTSAVWTLPSRPPAIRPWANPWDDCGACKTTYVRLLANGFGGDLLENLRVGVVGAGQYTR